MRLDFSSKPGDRRLSEYLISFIESHISQFVEFAGLSEHFLNEESCGSASVKTDLHERPHFRRPPKEWRAFYAVHETQEISSTPPPQIS